MKVQRGFEGECTRAKGPQKKAQLPAAAAVCSDMKDTEETVRTETVNEVKWLLMFCYFLTVEGVFKQRRMQKFRFRRGLEKDHFNQQIRKR